MRNLARRMLDRARVERELSGLARRLPDAGTQLGLMALHQERAIPPAQLSDIGFSVYSQTDEDGILLYIFSVIGATNRRSVEICAGDGIECNTANLIVNQGWHGLLVDGDPRNTAKARRFYGRARETHVFPPAIERAWVTRDGVNDIVARNGFTGEIDLLSLDLDGVDYWIWEALTVVTPRVVVLEYQDILGPDRSWTVPYADNFSAGEHSTTHGMPNFASASLRAFAKLGKTKGYRLVGVNHYGFNAFFVREGVGEELLAEVPVDACFLHPKVRAGIAERFPLVANAPWQEV